jgi:putative acetyltransferase
MRIPEDLQILSIQGGATLRYLTVIRALFQEYAAGLGFDLEFQDFQRELDELPGEYAPPQGRLFLALCKGNPAGCIALRPLAPRVCELKRLFVRPASRGRGIGSALAERLIREAGSMGYTAMRLDSIVTMEAALRLYRAFGFEEIPPYCYNPIPGAVYLELDLARFSTPGGTIDKANRP